MENFSTMTHTRVWSGGAGVGHLTMPALAGFRGRTVPTAIRTSGSAVDAVAPKNPTTGVGAAAGYATTAQHRSVTGRPPA